MKIKLKLVVDLNDPKQAKALRALTNSYVPSPIDIGTPQKTPSKEEAISEMVEKGVNVPFMPALGYSSVIAVYRVYESEGPEAASNFAHCFAPEKIAFISADGEKIQETDSAPKRKRRTKGQIEADKNTTETPGTGIDGSFTAPVENALNYDRLDHPLEKLPAAQLLVRNREALEKWLKHTGNLQAKTELFTCGTTVIAIQDNERALKLSDGIVLDLPCGLYGEDNAFQIEVTKPGGEGIRIHLNGKNLQPEVTEKREDMFSRSASTPLETPQPKIELTDVVALAQQKAKHLIDGVNQVPKVKAITAEFGATRVVEVKEEDLPALIEKLNQLPG